MKQIKLYGSLGKRFGRSFNFDVNTPAEAIRMLAANFKDFNEYMIKNSEPGFHVFVGKSDIGENDLANPSSDKEVIKIVPVIVGSSGAARIIIGAVLIAIGVFVPITSEYLIPLGTSLIIGGVAQLLFAPPVPADTSNSATINSPSYSFDGPVNTTRQGNPVAVGYGRLEVGSQVISAGLFAEAI